MGMYGWSSTASESPRAAPWAPATSLQRPNSYGGANYPGFSNNEVDANIAKWSPSWTRRRPRPTGP